MMYKLTWQTKVFDEWGDPQFVIGDIGPVHKCYNALVMAYMSTAMGESDPVPLRAVVTAIQAETDNTRGNVVYEWGWPISAPKEEEVAK